LRKDIFLTKYILSIDNKATRDKETNGNHFVG